MFSQPRLDILIFQPMLGLKYVCEYFQFPLDILMTVMALMEVWSQTVINKSWYFTHYILQKCYKHQKHGWCRGFLFVCLFFRLVLRFRERKKFMSFSCKHVSVLHLYLLTFNTLSCILFKISCSGFFLKYSQNFANIASVFI